MEYSINIAKKQKNVVNLKIKPSKFKRHFLLVFVFLKIVLKVSLKIRLFLK